MQKTSSQAEAQILCHSNEGRNPGPALIQSPEPNASGPLGREVG